MSLLEVRSLRAGYGKVDVVFDISLSVEPGQMVGIVGPNGAGKSTLLAAIAGAIAVRSGTVALDGQEITGKKPEDIVRLGLSLVPEGRQIFGDLSVRENLALGLTGRRDKSGAKAALELVHDIFPVLTTHSHHQAGMLSGGQQQQLAIARALVANPRVLLLDEPSLGLSPTVVKDVFDQLIQIATMGTAVVIVEQRAHLVTTLAERTHVLRAGKIQATLSPEDAQNESKLSAAYFGNSEG
ncbi:high-affinity branched-chain amino acid transport ATP-binding protein LivF [mine drainage metagenome]|uniref:High-affinity branched-chain amino acid transport ATP-binding protein LivF n=1 Tax=mine drainage metagenome TaxID=410659 RepID=A0A1J5PHQ4_9ZZZZ